MVKKLVAGMIGLVAVGVMAQETVRWIGGGQMYADMVKNGPYIGGSSLVVSPESLTTVGTNSSLTANRFYALQPGGNWELADNATIGKELVAYSYSNSISKGLLVSGVIENSTWTNHSAGTVMYVSATAGIADSDASYVRQVGVIIGEGILRLSAQ